MDLKILFILGVLTSGLPAEPPEQYVVNEYVHGSTGLYVREYAVLSKTINYITARQITAINRDTVDTVSFPLFYWYDWNGDGVFSDGEMYIDKRVEGCECDIVPYEIGMD